jgi:2-amino-4-hydroxy-6-hydroxymethyldihydropteridine diphosphokinase
MYSDYMPNGASHAAHLSIGSNLGDRARYCYAAVGMLSRHAQIHITAVSDLLETAPIGGPADAAPYLNGAISINTTLGPTALMDILLSIETAVGRVRQTKWEPRVLDLDLLLYGDRIFSSDELMIPHPLMHQRRFVLEPLSQIAPAVVHPTLLMNITGLLDRLK